MDSREELSFSACVDNIESAYEYMLAYAAQGRDREPAGGGSGPSVRQFLEQLRQAVSALAGAAQKTTAALPLSDEARTAVQGFLLQLEQDAGKAGTVINMVLTAPTLSSQLVDNLNASAHLRCLLTGIFIIDEVVQQHVRA